MARIMETKDKIINAAGRLFASKGYDQTGTKEIALEAGVSEMTLFRHFGTKENLFKETFERLVFAPNFEDFFKTKITYSFYDDLKNIGILFSKVVLNNIIPLKMNLNCLNNINQEKDPLREYQLKLQELMVDYLKTMKEKGQFNGNPERFSVIFLSACFGIIFNIEIIGILKKWQLRKLFGRFFYYSYKKHSAINFFNYNVSGY